MKLKIPRVFPALTAILSLAATAHAVPAKPGPTLIAQPDGQTVEVCINGDESRNWISTPEGFTLLRDGEGFLTFARSEKQEVKASELRYTGASSVADARLRGIKPGLMPKESRTARKAPAYAPATQIDGTFPAKGKCKLLMLLINFADKEPIYPSEAFDAYMNLEGFAGTGSFRDYYLENSYGLLDIETTVTRWITVPYPKSYYTTDNAESLITDALSIIDSEIDLREFDNDGDGVLDGLAVIHQGAGAEASGSSSDIWSHSGTLYGQSFDGIRLMRYTIQPEILYDSTNPNRMGTIGVMCHEFGHNLGAPDFYDTDYLQSGGEYTGTGVWDLMGGGAWNGPGVSGTQPAGINMWQKIQLGWVTPHQLENSESIVGMMSAHDNPVAYRFDTTEPGEYFILENRQQEGRFDSALPSHGLIIYHVNDNMIADNVVSNSLNTRFPQAMYTVCAGASTEPSENPGSYGWVNSEYAPFPGRNGVTAFHDTTIPSTKSMSGRYTYKGLTQIREDSDGSIAFEFMRYEMPETPVNLTATSRGGIVTLDWECPESEKPVCYNIFRNGENIATVDVPGYTDNDPGSESNVTYAVDAVYASGLISPYTSIRIFLPVNFVTDLNAEVEGSEVTLKWDLATRLSRMPKMSNNFVIHDYPVGKLEIAHLFRAEDLKVYQGYDIRYINFLAMQPQTALGVTIRVYEQTPGTSDMKVVSERKVSEFAYMQWTNSLLSKTVKITGEKDIIISVTFTSKSGASIQALCDLEPVANGMGNLSRTDDGEWGRDRNAQGNFFIAATLRAPEHAEGSAPEIQPVEDFLADTSYPVGFAVYQNGHEIARTVGRTFTHTSEPGDHIYTVTSLYKGSNESAAIEKAVNVEQSLSMESLTETGMKISSLKGSIELTGAYGHIEVTDIAGRCIASVDSDGSAVSISVPAGMYIVTCGPQVAKVAVK
ncbi:MAG: M6 family metalloprotease domain-containing protein [Muribaculaceae bacterium]|nr:M6 family metalloprotease domain-containing protein [Muribaculaceae bacterium]